MFSPRDLQTLLSLADTGSFAKTATALRVAGSTVSLHIDRLESAAGAELLVRSPTGARTVEPTVAGGALLKLAKEIVAAHDRADRWFRPDRVVGRLRLAVADDLASAGLGVALREFGKMHPRAKVEVTVGQSGPLQRRLRAGQFDLALVKRHPVSNVGDVLARNRLGWVASPGFTFPPGAPLPLVLYPTSSFIRLAATTALDRAGRAWRIANTVRGVNGTTLALRAGLGIGVLAATVTPPDLLEVGARFELPSLGDIDIVLLQNQSTGPEPADTLRAFLVTAGDSIVPNGY